VKSAKRKRKDRGKAMTDFEGIKCYHCGRGFYLRGFRFQEAKTVSCMFCGKKIIKSKAEGYDK